MSNLKRIQSKLSNAEKIQRAKEINNHPHSWENQNKDKFKIFWVSFKQKYITNISIHDRETEQVINIDAIYQEYKKEETPPFGGNK